MAAASDTTQTITRLTPLTEVLALIEQEVKPVTPRTLDAAAAGGRTLATDVEWQYVNVRRYFIYLERSIDNSTQWAVFEPNGSRLWDNIRSSVEDFLYNEWFNHRLLGASPKEAYFVRCDRSTMTQNDIDNGRMVCLVGVAPLRPAEFVIFRIGQKTADAK